MRAQHDGAARGEVNEDGGGRRTQLAADAVTDDGSAHASTHDEADLGRAGGGEGDTALRKGDHRGHVATRRPRAAPVGIGEVSRAPQTVRGREHA